MRRREVLYATTSGLSAVGTGLSRAHPADTPTPFTGQPSGTADPKFEPLASLPIDGAKDAVVDAAGTTAYVATTSGFAIVDISDPAEPTVLANQQDVLASHEGGPLRQIQDVKIHDDRLLVVGPAHPGGPDALNAALVYDVSNPAAPEQVAVRETEFPIHNALVDAEYAYLTAFDGDRNPLVILDGNDLDEVGRWSLLDHQPEWSRVDPRVRVFHDLYVRDGIAYLAYWDAGTWIVDVTDPRSPRVLGRAGGRPPDQLEAIDDDVSDQVNDLPGNHHTAGVDETGTLLAIGKEAWSSDPTKAPGGIELWDVTRPTTPTHLSTISPPPTDDASRTGTWTTAHNFDLVNRRLYSSWYQGGVKVHDVRDPRNPVELAWWSNPQTTRFWTAQRAKECVVATTMGINDEPPGLYTFPLLPPQPTETPTKASITQRYPLSPLTVTTGFGLFAILTAVAIGLRHRYHRRQ